MCRETVCLPLHLRTVPDMLLELGQSIIRQGLLLFADV